MNAQPDDPASRDSVSEVPALLDEVRLLAAPPQSPGRLLILLRRALDSDPAGTDTALAHLEALYAGLPEDLTAAQVIGLGLPRSLGVTLDLRVRAGELGVVPDRSPSGAAPLRLLAGTLGVDSVFELASAGRGALHQAQLPQSHDQLVEAVSSMLLLGAEASALRYAALALLVDLPGRTPETVTRTGLRLLRRRRAMVPPDFVVPVWKLFAASF